VEDRHKGHLISTGKPIAESPGTEPILNRALPLQTLIGFPQMCVLCLFEFTSKDSVAEVILAIAMLFSVTTALCWASLKVVRLAKRSVSMHKNPAYILYSDPACLNKWGFLYVQYRATAYYFIIPVLVYIFLKSIFIAVAQSSPVTQAVALVILEAAFLIGVCILRPWMDKKTNAYNISIASINFVNAIFLLIFTNIFNQPVRRHD
jgi:Transient receptor potential (TRP) ion channel